MIHRIAFGGTQMVRSRLVMGIAAGTAVAVGAVGGALLGVPGLSGAQPFPQAATQVAATNAAKPHAGPGRGALASPLIDGGRQGAQPHPAAAPPEAERRQDHDRRCRQAAGRRHQDGHRGHDERRQDRINKIVNKPWPQFGGGKGNGSGKGGPATAPGAPGAPGGAAGPAGGRFGFGFGLGRIENLALDPVAKALGITTAELKTDLANGQTIADIAKAKNVDVNTVINTLVAAPPPRSTPRLPPITSRPAQADKLKTALTKGITDLVNNGFPKGPKSGGPFGGMGHGRFRGPKGGSNTPPTTAAAPTA